MTGNMNLEKMRDLSKQKGLTIRKTATPARPSQIENCVEILDQQIGFLQALEVTLEGFAYTISPGGDDPIIYGIGLMLNHHRERIELVRSLYPK
jgi:hypothetical protein